MWSARPEALARRHEALARHRKADEAREASLSALLAAADREALPSWSSARTRTIGIVSHFADRLGPASGAKRQNNAAATALHTLAEHNHRAYARRHGYLGLGPRECNATQAVDISPRPWAKVPLLSACLGLPSVGSDALLVWLDADVLITAPAKRVEAVVAEALRGARGCNASWSILVGEDTFPSGMHGLNTGVIVSRRTLLTSHAHVPTAPTSLPLGPLAASASAPDDSAVP